MRKCTKCNNEADIEGQDLCDYCAMEELFESTTKEQDDSSGSDTSPVERSEK
jgi:hypothetical protein